MRSWCAFGLPPKPSGSGCIANTSSLADDPDPFAKIQRLLAQREPFYRQADVLVNTELRSVREVAQQVAHQFHLVRGDSLVKPTLKHLALELGFDGCQVTSADPPASAARFRQWLESGCHGESGISPTQRSEALGSATGPGRSPHNHYPCRQLRIQERSLRAAPTRSPTRRVLARYARYSDYHTVLAEKLKVLAQRVDALAVQGHSPFGTSIPADP